LCNFASSDTTYADEFCISSDDMSKILGLIDLEPRKQIKADLKIAKEILQRNTTTSFGYGSLVLIEKKKIDHHLKN